MAPAGPGTEMPRTRVKICGITRVEDALAAAHSGADAIGLVFHPASPRAVSLSQAQAIRAALPPFVTVVGLFVDAPAAQVEAVMGQVALDLLQFHGDEAPQYCRAFGRPYLKAVRMRPGVDLHIQSRRFADAAALLLDSYQRGVPGGTGLRFDWARIPDDLEQPLVLAGGLDPDNVAQAVRQVRPYAVDVSGGVEVAKGVKDETKIAAFIRGVTSVDTD